MQPVKPVALFSGVLPVGTDGKADDSVPRADVSRRAPHHGDHRRPDEDRPRRGEVTVKDPLVIQVTFPRFVTQGDEMQIPVFMTNMSGGPLEVQLSSAAQ